MKPLVVYYSFSGNNRLLAEHIARLIDADICPVIEVKKRTNFRIFLDVIFRRQPGIKNLDLPIEQYDNIIFIAPVWAAKIATPMRSLLQKKRKFIERYTFVTLCGGYDIKGQKEKLIEELTDLVGKPPVAVYELRISELFPPDKRRNLRLVSGYHADNKDLPKFSQQIQQITALR